jgi:hypothetical protein
MEGETMSVGKIDELIQAVQHALEQDIDIETSGEWKIECMEYLEKHLGPEHYYTQYFCNYMKEVDQQALCTGRGLLVAAKEALDTEK